MCLLRELWPAGKKTHKKLSTKSEEAAHSQSAVNTARCTGWWEEKCLLLPKNSSFLDKWKWQWRHCLAERPCKEVILADGVKYYMEMEDISCFLGFDLTRQRERLRPRLSRTGGLPNFDHSGKYPCTVILSSVTLSEAMCAAIRLPPLAFSHPYPFYYLIFFPQFFFLSLVCLQAPSIFPSRRSSAAVHWDGQMGSRERDAGFRARAFPWTSGGLAAEPLFSLTMRKCASQTGTVNLRGIAITGICLMIDCPIHLVSRWP